MGKTHGHNSGTHSNMSLLNSNAYSSNTTKSRSKPISISDFVDKSENELKEVKEIKEEKENLKDNNENENDNIEKENDNNENKEVEVNENDDDA